MCGIGGFYRYGDKPIDYLEVQSLLCNLEKRGTHATGIVLQYDSGRTVIKKAPVPAWEFVSDKDWDEFVGKYFEVDKDLPRICLLHTRWATVGNPNDNKNNHPMFAGKSAIVHNGSVGNHNFLFTNKKLDRKAETDSDLIRAIVDKWGITKEAIAHLNDIQGSCAIAAVNPEYPQKLLLGKSGKPLVMGWNEDRKMLAWASEKEILYNATRDTFTRAGFWFSNNRSNYLFHTVPKDSMYIIGEKGQEFKTEFKSAPYTSSDDGIIYRCNENYFETMGRFNQGKKPPGKKSVIVQSGPIYVNAKLRLVRCRNEECRLTLELTPEQIEEPLYEIYCQTCGTYIMDEPTVKASSSK